MNGMSGYIHEPLLECPTCHQEVAHVGRTVGGMVILSCQYQLQPHEYEVERIRHRARVAKTLAERALGPRPW